MCRDMMMGNFIPHMRDWVPVPETIFRCSSWTGFARNRPGTDVTHATASWRKERFFVVRDNVDAGRGSYREVCSATAPGWMTIIPSIVSNWENTKRMIRNLHSFRVPMLRPFQCIICIDISRSGVDIPNSTPPTRVSQTRHLRAGTGTRTRTRVRDVTSTSTTGWVNMFSSFRCTS